MNELKKPVTEPKRGECAAYCVLLSCLPSQSHSPAHDAHGGRGVRKLHHNQDNQDGGVECKACNIRVRAVWSGLKEQDGAGWGSAQGVSG